MKQEVLSISRTHNLFYRYGIALGAAVFMGAGIATLDASWPILLTIAVFVCIPIVAVFSYYGVQFKHVTLVDACLEVSDGERSAHVPLAELERVFQWTMNPSAIVLELRHASPFGRRIVFSTPGYFPSPWQANPLVSQLLELSRNTRVHTCTHGGGALEPGRWD
jgi:hypothetical protein